MQVDIIETPGLGDRTYVVSSHGTALVIDPQRDIDRVLEHLADRGLELALVCETHIHNDYVTGGLALARITGADYGVSADDPVAFDRRPIDDDTVIDLGSMSLRAVHTPGHTPTHLSYVLADDSGSGGAVFTGGSMLYATVGRTDLIGPDTTEGLTRDQYRSVRRLAEILSTDTSVYPTHGFGSFCASAGGGSRTSGTIADERKENLACTTASEDVFVETLMNGFAAYPPYYAHMGPLNLAGPLPPDLTTPRPTTPEDLAARIDRGEWVVDVRPRREFADSHLRGSISVDVDGALATYLGWAIPWGIPLSLIGRDEAQVSAAQRELVRIGLDRPMSVAVGGPEVYAVGQDVASYPARTFADLATEPDAIVVDVRRTDEWDDGHVEGATHMTVEQLADGAGDLPDDVWVHCATGFRASIAASIIARAGKSPTWIDDDWEKAADSRRTLTG